ncbi:MAG: putative ABC transport system permease protein [Paraglaciecola sp.]|jgi:predicted permease
MYANNFKIALRTLLKNKIYTGINLFGLTIGIAAALLIFRMVTYELSFNKEFENYDHIVRLVSEATQVDGGKYYSTCTPLPAMDEMEAKVPQFAAFGRIMEMNTNLMIRDESQERSLQKYALGEDESPFFAEQDFTNVFKLNWLAGNEKTALTELATIILTKKWAEKCFDNWESAMGKTVYLENIIPVVVTGVVDNLPVNCDFTFPFLVSYETLKNNAKLFNYSGDWGSCSSSNQVYARLEDKADRTAAVSLLAMVGEKEYKNSSGKSGKAHIMQPLSDLHYNEDLNHSGSHRTSKSRLKLLSFIGFLILIMASFNFINLATAQATLRAKEVGVRKTLGSSRKELIGQFMSETGILVLVSVVLGANLAVLGSPLLKYVSDVPDHIPFLSQPKVWVFLGIIALVITLLAGLYPALRLSGYQPVRALNNNVSHESSGGAAVRKSLVVLQFAVAQALIIGTMITILQMDYIQSRDLGFSKDLIYTFNYNTDSLTVARQSALKQTLLQIPTVEAVSMSADQPLSGNTWKTNWRFGDRPEDEPYALSIKMADSDYQETFALQIIEGRYLMPSDTMREGVLNETAIKKLGFQNPAEAIGEHFTVGRYSVKLVGVVKDFHTHSLRNEHEPTVITTAKDEYSQAAVKIRNGDIPNTIAAIQTGFDKVLPEQIFGGSFMDENINRFYEDEQRLSATCRGLGLLAILISCLGLFGLATHAATQRVKEIGIRKVLGASVTGIISLLSKDFLKLVILAMVIAAPVAWWLMNSWLEDFAYRVDIEWWVFAAAAFVAVAIAFLSVSYQSVRAAMMNPVESLRSE